MVLAGLRKGNHFRHSEGLTRSIGRWVWLGLDVDTVGQVRRLSKANEWNADGARRGSYMWDLLIGGDGRDGEEMVGVGRARYRICGFRAWTRGERPEAYALSRDGPWRRLCGR